RCKDPRRQVVELGAPRIAQVLHAGLAEREQRIAGQRVIEGGWRRRFRRRCRFGRGGAGGDQAGGRERGQGRLPLAIHLIPLVRCGGAWPHAGRPPPHPLRPSITPEHVHAATAVAVPEPWGRGSGAGGQRARPSSSGRGARAAPSTCSAGASSARSSGSTANANAAWPGAGLAAEAPATTVPSARSPAITDAPA